MTGLPPHFALRYMSRFVCKGGTCEDTCCSGWQVAVDEPHYKQLKRVMSGSRAERARFRAIYVPEPVLGDARRHARLRLLPDGDCAMLDEQRGCAIQSRYGEAMLSDTCATYPRAIGVVDGRVELAGMLSCPEVARLALLDADAMELDRFDPKTLPRALAHATSTMDAYAAPLDEVRGTICALLASSELSLAARMFLVARFADRTRPILHRGVATLDEAALAAEIAAAIDPVSALRWALHFDRMETSGPRAGYVLAHALRARLALGSGGGFATLLQRILPSYGTFEGGQAVLDPAELLASYERQSRPWQTAWGTRIDELFTNYCKHYWMKEWYVGSPDLLVHAQKLHLRVALQRFLLFSHPELGPSDHPEAGPRLERATVEVIHRFSRAMEHERKFVEHLEALLVELELTSLAQAVFLLKL